MCQGDNITVHFFCVVQFNISFFKSAFSGKASDIFRGQFRLQHMVTAQRQDLKSVWEASHCNNCVKNIKFTKGHDISTKICHKNNCLQPFCYPIKVHIRKIQNLNMDLVTDLSLQLPCHFEALQT